MNKLVTLSRWRKSYTGIFTSDARNKSLGSNFSLTLFITFPTLEVKPMFKEEAAR